MGSSPSAKLFYGLVNPNDGEGENSGWGDHFTLTEKPVTIELFGYESFLRYAIAITESVIEVSWNGDRDINPMRLLVPTAWDSEIETYARERNIDIHGLEPGWHLVSLYF